VAINQSKRDSSATTDQIQSLVVDLELVVRALRSRIPEEWFTLELTMPQVRTLFALLRGGEARMGTLAPQLGVSLSSATGLVDRLLEKRLVEREVDPDDRRSVIVRLAAEGQDLVERLLYLRRSWWEDRLGGLTGDEVERAQDGLRTLLDGLARPASSEDDSQDGPSAPAAAAS
jgi:DNA-binding MarR family transcriptional regulator